MLDLIFSTSRAGAEAFSWPDPFAVISVTDPGSQTVIFKQRNLVARCRLEFWDLDFETGDDRVVFDAVMAQTVLKFVERECGAAKLLLVHCEAGISRSTALANALGEILSVDVRHQNALFSNPNVLVARLLLEEAGRRSTATR